MSPDAPPTRVLLAKLGFDGHDRGLKVIARTLRDAGCEVVYLGLRQTTESVVIAAEQEDVAVIGISMHNAGHLTLGPMMVQAVADAGLDIPVIIGGIVPAADVPALKDAGIFDVLGPGTPLETAVAAVRAAASTRSGSTG
jgi:methylmalonyl-CoA mutase C-terminal domain/subunit